MPANSDALNPGETLEAGEYLVSPNGLYRLYMDPAGWVGLYAYTIDTPVNGLTGTYNIRTILWTAHSPNTGDAAVRLVFPANGRCRLENAAGHNIGWHDSQPDNAYFADYRLNSNPPNNQLRLYDNGDLIHNAFLPNGQNFGHSFDTRIQAGYCFHRSYPPNTGTATILVGQVAASVSDTSIINDTPKLIGVRVGNDAYGLPGNGGSLPIATEAGVVKIEMSSNYFLSLSGPLETASTLPHNSQQTHVPGGEQSGDGNPGTETVSLWNGPVPHGKKIKVSGQNFDLSLTDSQHISAPQLIHPPQHLIDQYLAKHHHHKNGHS
ncbi:MAG: hypothetical protein U0798_17905 [Gemmataceae bacterium]